MLVVALLGCDAPASTSGATEGTEGTGEAELTSTTTAPADPVTSSTAPTSSTATSTTTSTPTETTTLESTSTHGDASESTGTTAGDGTTGSSGSSSGGSSGGETTGTTGTGTTSETTFATTSSSTGETETTGTGSDETETSSSTGPPLMLPDPLPQSDEFDDAEHLGTQWQLRNVVEATPEQYTTLDIDKTRPGYLTLIPTTSGWYNDFDGPLIYTTLTGDFMVEVEVEALNVDGGGGPPTQFYNSAGIMIRDPSHGPGIERWVTHNVGYQDDQVGTERKITFVSASTLVVTPSVHTGRLRMCRVGNQILLTRRMADETEFTEINTYEVMTFPDEVQVGMNVTAWNSLSAEPNTDEDPDLLAQWNYIRFYPATETDLCFVNEP